MGAATITVGPINVNLRLLVLLLSAWTALGSHRSRTASAFLSGPAPRKSGGNGFRTLLQNRVSALRSSIIYPDSFSAPTYAPFANSSITSRPRLHVELHQDIPLAPPVPSRPPTPRPADLPGLSRHDLIMLRAGQRVQHQIRNGCMGSGYVVIDVLAPAQHVWDSLLSFERYAEMIPTIRGVQIKSRWRNFTKGIFCLSKFRIRLSVVHRYRPEESRLDFYSDPDTDQYRGILQMAEGFWFLDEKPADRPPGWTRVYMTAQVKVNSLVPMWLVDYAADRALTRATKWLKPWIEQGHGLALGERRD